MELVLQTYDWFLYLLALIRGLYLIKVITEGYFRTFIKISLIYVKHCHKKDANELFCKDYLIVYFFLRTLLLYVPFVNEYLFS